MSYILDALRKSELERRMRETPTLTTTETDLSEENNKTKWIIIAAVLIILNLSALGFWWFSSSKNQPQVAIQKNPSEQYDAAKNSTGVAKLEANNIQEKAPAQKAIENTVETKNLEPNQESISEMLAKQQKKYRPRAKPSSIKKPRRNTETTIAKAPTEPSPVTNVSPPVTQPRSKPSPIVTNELPPKEKLKKPEPPYFAPSIEKNEELAKNAPLSSYETGVDRNNVNQAPQSTASDKRPPPFLHQMSRTFQREIPKINLNVQMYSPEADSSFVIIDMIKFYEGQTLGESNIVLEEITPDDVILSYDGDFFRISAN